MAKALAASRVLPNRMNMANVAFITNTGLSHTDMIAKPFNKNLLRRIAISLSLNVFSLLMDMRQDFFIDNIISFFQEKVVRQISKSKNADELTKIDFESDFKTLFHENMLASG